MLVTKLQWCIRYIFGHSFNVLSHMKSSCHSLFKFPSETGLCCAKVHVALFENLDLLTTMLNLSKCCEWVYWIKNKVSESGGRLVGISVPIKLHPN